MMTRLRAAAQSQAKRAALILLSALLFSCAGNQVPPEPPMPDHGPSVFKFERRSDRLWYWVEFDSRNHRKIGESDQGYQRIYFAKKNAARHGWVEGVN